MIAPVQQNVRAALLLALSGFATLSIGDALVKTMAGSGRGRRWRCCAIRRRLWASPCSC